MSKRIDKRKLSEAIRTAEDMNVDYRGLTEEEVEKLRHSADALKNVIKQIEL